MGRLTKIGDNLEYQGYIKIKYINVLTFGRVNDALKCAIDMHLTAK